VEQTFRASEGVLLVEGRVLRRVIKAHRNLKGLGLTVPHVHCYAIPRDELLRVASPEDLDEQVRAQLGRTTDLARIVLVARLSQAEAARLPAAEVTNRLWRAAFHARVHAEVEQRMDSGVLTEAMVRERIDHIGQTEFDEIREILKQDDLLLPPGGDRESYTEFVALFLELRYFAPRLLQTTFPSLDTARVEREIARDVDARLLVERACPEGVDPGQTIALAEGASSTSTGTAMGLPAEAAKYTAPEGAAAERMMTKAGVVRATGNRVRAALLHAAVGLGKDPLRVRAAKAREREDLEALGERLKAALRPPPGEPPKPDLEWTSLLMILTDEGAMRSGLRYSVEARLLLDLQNAALAHEQMHHSVDLITWALSRGKRPIVRPLPATRTLRIARLLHAAAKKVKLVRIAPADRKLLTKLIDRAGERADENVRSELRPKIRAVLEEVGLRPASTPERVARNKLVEELLDQAVERGFLTIGDVRDALSRNHLKLSDLAGASELWKGDALLQADKALAVSLDGVYRPGEIYMRGLQKVSSILFGTGVGRAIILYLVLPLGGAFIVLEGASHILAPVAGLFEPHHGGKAAKHSFTLFQGNLLEASLRHKLPEELRGLTTISFLVTAVLMFGLIHSETFRNIMKKIVRVIGAILGALFIRGPKFLLSLPSVERVLEGRVARVIARHAILPGLVATVVFLALYFLLPDEKWWLQLGVALCAFAGVSATLGTRLGDNAEDLFVEHVAPTWKMLSHKVLPGVFKAIVDFFKWLMDGLERVIYRVDEALRFREGESKIVVGFKAGLGAIWFLVAYVIRIYIALLIEPYVNPVKQVPMTAAAHKMMLPFAPQIIAVFDAAFRGIPLVGGPLAAVTAFFFPTIFGFFGWELKENFKLYQASRAKSLGESVIGAHGETMNGFLVAGFHSGTLPKVFARLRHAARREEEMERAAGEGASMRRSKGEGARGRFREGMHEIELSIRHFIEREMLRLLAADSRWPHGPLSIERVELSSNRVRVRILCPGIAMSQVLPAGGGYAPGQATPPPGGGYVAPGQPTPPPGGGYAAPGPAAGAYAAPGPAAGAYAAPGQAAPPGGGYAAPGQAAPPGGGYAAPGQAASGAAASRNPGKEAFEISFEEQSGYVVAGVVQVGFASALRSNARILFENALAGVYKLAATDLVREQLEMAMGGEMPYDIADDGLVVWPGPGYVVEALYPLRTDASVIEPTLRGGLPQRPLPPLDARQISFRHQPIAWSAWVYAWSPEAGKDVPRLMSGPSLIPA
jgi:hypothetical protein